MRWAKFSGIFANGAHMNINAFNDQRQDELALYTPGTTTGTSDDGVEVLVRMDEPIAVNPPLPEIARHSEGCPGQGRDAHSV